MQSKTLLILINLLAWSAVNSGGAEDVPQLKGPKEKISYAIGVETARNFKNQGVEFDLEIVLKGMKDGLANGALLLSDKELRNTLISVQSELRRKQSIENRVPGISSRGKSEPPVR